MFLLDTPAATKTGLALMRLPQHSPFTAPVRSEPEFASKLSGIHNFAFHRSRFQCACVLFEVTESWNGRHPDGVYVARPPNDLPFSCEPAAEPVR
jgi:hypothetical protein